MANAVRVADIVPNLDPSRYRTGAAEIEALNKKLASSFDGLGTAEKAQAEAFARTRTEATAATTSYERLLGRTDQMQAATNKANDTINRAARAWQQQKISIDEFIRIAASANAQLDVTREKFTRVGQAANDNVAGVRGYGSALASLEGTAASLTGRLGSVGTALSALGPVGLAAGAALGAAAAAAALMISAGERMNQLDGRLKVATGSAQGAAKAFDAIFASAQQIGAPIQAGVELFGRMSMAAKDLGASRSEVLKLTDTIQKLAIAGGSSSQEAASGAQQLGQALASGVLQGDELRSILENMPMLAKALADGLNTSVGRLREMGAAGELTSQRVFQAIVSQSGQADKLFGQLGDSVERAQARMGNAWDVLLARLNKIFGASEALARLYNNLAAGIEAVTPGNDEGRLGKLLAERDALLSRQNNRRGDLAGIPEEFAKDQPTFSNADTVREEIEERKRLKSLDDEIFALEMKREADLRGIQAEAAQARQDAFKRQYDAMQLIGRSLDELLGQYQLETAQLTLSDYALKKLAATEKARLDYLKENGVASPAALAALQVSDPGRAVALTAGADKAGAAAGDLADAQRKKDLDDYNRSQAEELRLLAAAPAARYKVQAAIEAEALVRKGLIDETEKSLYQKQIESKLYAQAADAVGQQSAATQRAIAGNLALADAWSKGGVAAEIASAKMQAREAAATKAGVSEAKLAEQIRNTNAAATAADMAKRNADLADQNAALMLLIEAEKKGAEAVAEVELAEKKRIATVKARAELAAATDPAVKAALEYQIRKTEEQIDLDARGQAARKIAALERQQQQDLSIALAEREIALEADPSKRAAMEQALALKTAELQIRQQNVNAGEEEIQKSLRLAEAIIKTQAETKRAQEIQGKSKEIFDDIANLVEQAGQRGGKGFFTSFVDWGRAAIKTLAKEMLFRPLIQPIIGSFVGAVPGLFGLAGGTGTSAGAASGGLGSILSPITDAIGIAKSFLGDAIGGVSSWINGIGSSLGFGSGIAAAAPSAAFIGPMPLATGALGTTTSLSGLLGGAGAGFGAGMLLNSLFGGSQVGGMIGSGVGSLGGALAGTFLFPGVGTLLGGLLGGGAGGIIGGLFGKDESKPLGNARLGEVVGNRLTYGGDTTLDGYDNSREIAQMQQAVSTVNSIIDKFGLTLNEDLLRRGFEDTSNPIGLIGKTSTFDGPANLEEWFKRFFGGREGQSYLGGATGTLGTAFDRLASGGYKPETGDDVLKMLDYAGSFDDAVKRAGAGVNTLARQTLEWEIAARDAGKGLQKTVKDYIQQATDYFGAGSTQEAQAQTAQRQAIYAQIGLDPGGSAIDPTAPSTMLTGRDADLAQARAQIAAYQDALVATGLTAEESAAKIAAGNAATAAAINARWDEVDRRDKASFHQREAVAQIAAGRGGNAQDIAVSALAEQQRQALVDAEAAGMSKLNLERLKEVQLVEAAALAHQQANETADRDASLRQREVEAQLKLGKGVKQDDVEQYALGVQQWREMIQAQNEGWQQSKIDRLQYVQGLEMESLRLDQAVRARQKEEGYIQRTASALAGVLSGSPLAQQAEYLTQDIARQIAQGEELRAALSDTDLARIKEIEKLEDSAVAAQRAAAAQQQYQQALKSVVDQLDQFRTRAKDWSAGVMAGPNSPANYQARYGTALSNYDTQLALARGGDADAIASIMQYADTLIAAGRDYQSNNAAQGDLVARVLAEVQGLPDQIDQLEMVRLQIEKLDNNITPPTAEQTALLDQLNDLSDATKLAIDQSASDAATQAAAAAALQAAQKVAVEAGNNLSAAIVAQIGASNQQLGYVKTSTENSAASLGLMVAQNNTLTGVLNALNGSLQGMANLGSIMAGVGQLVAANTNHRQDVWNAEAQWLWKITSNTGRTVERLGGVPQYAVGTDNHPGGMAILGERGPELVNLPGGAQVFTATETAAMLAPPRIPGMARGAGLSNDNTAVVSGLREVAAVGRDGNRISAASGRQMAAMGAEIAALRAEIAALRREGRGNANQRKIA